MWTLVIRRKPPDKEMPAATELNLKCALSSCRLVGGGGGACKVGTAPMGLAPKRLTDAYSNSLESSKFRKLPQGIEEAGKETSQIKYDESRNNLDCSTWVEHPWHPER